MSSRLSAPFAFVLTALAVGSQTAWAGDDAQAEKVVALLDSRCFKCHSHASGKNKGGLVMDSLAGLTTGGDGGAALLPGNPAKSLFLQNILETDPEKMMPPKGDRLTKDEVTLLQDWVKSGATWPKSRTKAPVAGRYLPGTIGAKEKGWWAYQAVKLPELPAGKSAHPIERFIDARLAKEGLTPSAEADRSVLIRRVTFDATGLPPTPEDVAAFVKSTDPLAYEKLVDRLLASPAYGQRMARAWLDLVRYADSDGFRIDDFRPTAWRYRDYVIKAYNDNKPYDRFIAEQIAGDLMPDTDDGKLIATGFQRNNMNTHEGGTIPAENLVNYNADRVKTLGESVLGLTLACAQCHDHKFDPISQKDYYRIFAFFNTLDDRAADGNAGVNSLPSALRKTVLKTDELPALLARIAALNQRLQDPDPKVLAQWERTQQQREADRKLGLKLIPVKLLKISTPNSGGGFTVEGNQFKGITKTAFDILGETPQTEAPIAGLRFIFPDTLAAPKPTKAAKAAKAAKAEPIAAKPMDEFAGRFVLTAVDVTADKVAGDQVNIHHLQKFSHITADAWTEDYPAKDVRAFNVLNQGWSPPAGTGTHHLTVTFATPITAKDQPYLTTQIYFGNKMGGAPSEGELFAFTGHDDGTDLPEFVLRILTTKPAGRYRRRGR